MMEVVEKQKVLNDHFLLNNDVVAIELSASTPLVQFKWKLTSGDIKRYGFHSLAENEMNTDIGFSERKDTVNSLKNIFLLLDKDTIYQQLESIYVNLGRQCFLMNERGIVPPSLFKKEDIICIRERYTWFPSETLRDKDESDKNNQWMYDLSMFILKILYEYVSETEFNGSDEQVKKALDIIKGSPLFFSINRAIKDNKDRVFIHM